MATRTMFSSLMGQGLIEDEQLVGLLIDRINHVETVYVASIFGLLVTTALSAIGAAYIVRQDANDSESDGSARGDAPQRRADSPALFVIGASLLLTLLSGYYYFFLAHFYSAVATLVQLEALPNAASNPLVLLLDTAYWRV